MVYRLTGCCTRGTLTRKESLIAAGLTIAGALVLAASLMIWDDPTFKTIALTMSPGVWVLPYQLMVMRGHSLRAKVVLTGGLLSILFLIGLVASLIQSAR